MDVRNSSHAVKDRHAPFFEYVARVGDAMVADFDWCCGRLSFLAAWNLHDAELCLVQNIEDLSNSRDGSSECDDADGENGGEEYEYPPIVLSDLDLRSFEHLLKWSERALDLIRSFRALLFAEHAVTDNDVVGQQGFASGSGIVAARVCIRCGWPDAGSSYCRLR